MVLHLHSVTARQSSSGRQPNFVALNRGRHLYSARRPSSWLLAHILVLFLSIFFPRQFSAVADWMSTILLHMVWLNANLGCRSETCCTRLAENTGPKKIAKNSPSAHHRTTLWGYIFATKARIDNRKKKLVKQQYLPHTSLQYGVLWPTSS